MCIRDSKDSVMFQLNDILCNKNNDFSDWSEGSVCALLSKMKHSSPGSDDIPTWFYKLFANEIGLVVSKILILGVMKDGSRFEKVTALDGKRV